jgi:hypothetical protein
MGKQEVGIAGGFKNQQQMDFTLNGNVNSSNNGYWCSENSHDVQIFLCMTLTLESFCTECAHCPCVLKEQ